MCGITGIIKNQVSSNLDLEYQIKKMSSSLMAPASRLGLNAQQVRDIVEYIKVN